MSITFNGRPAMVASVSLLALCIAAPAAFAQAGPSAPETSDVVVIVGQTIEETLPQELEKYG